MISACMLLWCIGQSIAPGDRVTFTNDVRHTNRTERILAYETSWLVGGVVAQTTAANADFKKVYDNMVAFRGDQYLWWQVAEYTYDTFMIRARAASKG